MSACVIVPAAADAAPLSGTGVHAATAARLANNSDRAHNRNGFVLGSCPRPRWCLKHSTEILVDPTNDRQKQSGWTGVMERPVFVVVHRDGHAFPGVLFEWRRRASDGLQRSARVVYLDAYKVLRQSWFLEPLVEPASFARPDGTRPRLTQSPPARRRPATSRSGVAG